MNIDVFPDADAAAKAGAAFVAEQARAAARSRGLFTFAVSGGHTPWLMLAALARETMPWEDVQVVQVDERIAPSGDPDRNLTHLRESLLAHAPLREDQIHPMPVESANLESAAANYARTLQEIAGSPPVLDLVHLGLGPDGHTASLIPGDPVLNVSDADVAVTGSYQGRQRMTLTYPAINRARNILWLVTGDEKAEMLSKLMRADQSIPAGRVSQEHAVVIADRAAARQLVTTR
jgi:6-phosphogluconolactonase